MPLPAGRPYISDETPGPALAILAICSAGTSALVVGSTIAYQIKHNQLARESDFAIAWNVLLSFALMVSVAQSTVTATQVQYGLGYQIDILTSEEITTFIKLEYANNILYVGSLLLLKGVQLLLQRSTFTAYHKRNYYIFVLVMAGMLAFLFAAAFECSSPFWKVRENKCINQTAFWIVFGVYDIFSDIYLVSTVIWVSASLKLRTPAKIKLLLILASKFLPIGCAIARLPFIHAAYTAPNYTIASYKLGMPTQIQLHLSVMALSLGKIFRFLNSLDVGYLSASIEPNHGKGSANHMYASKSGTSSKSIKYSMFRQKREGVINDYDSSKNLVPADYGRAVTEIEGGIAMAPVLSRETQIGCQNRGDMTEAQMKENEIVVTTQFEVRTE